MDDTSVEKSTKISKGIVQITFAKKPCKEVDLLLIGEERLDELDLDLLRLKADNRQMQNVGKMYLQ